MSYTPPITEMNFILHDVLGIDHPELDRETTEAIFDEAGKLASSVLAPINHSGDQNGTKYDPQTHKVTTAPGFKEAYKEYQQGGWNALPFDPDYDGQGLPWAVAFPVQEMWQAANMSFGLCPLLNQGAVEALTSHGSQELKDTYLPKLISGEWTGTMNLTEPQAGSDLGLLKTKTEPQADGSYKITGQKIYITYGEHDMADNIIHLVLARLPDAPDDVKGISLFIVPKFLEDGKQNDSKCIGIEHKLGIHASPTCTMEFDGAIGYLIGEPHMGLKYMFTMMNNARLSVGLQGVAIAQRAYEHAEQYAAQRIQGKDMASGERVSIDQHADIKRMLLSMRSRIESGRLLTYQAADALDRKDPMVNLLTPLVKSWCTDMACDVTSTGIQVFGGMGFVEETGAAQFFRDARILPIYEGTNGIQAADLVFRKVIFNQGKDAEDYITNLQANLHTDHQAAITPLLEQLRAVTKEIIKQGGDHKLDAVAFASKAYLDGFSTIAGACLLSCSQKALHDDLGENFIERKKETVQFFIDHILPQAGAHLTSAQNALK